MTVPLELLTSGSTSEPIWIFVVRHSRPLWRQWWHIVIGEMKGQGVGGKSLASVLKFEHWSCRWATQVFVHKYERVQKYVTTKALKCAAFCVFGMTFKKMEFVLWYVYRAVVIGFRNPSNDKSLRKR